MMTEIVSDRLAENPELQIWFLESAKELHDLAKKKYEFAVECGIEKDVAKMFVNIQLENLFNEADQEV